MFAQTFWFYDSSARSTNSPVVCGRLMSYRSVSTSVRVKRAEIYESLSPVSSEMSSIDAVRSLFKKAKVLYREKSDLISACSDCIMPICFSRKLAHLSTRESATVSGTTVIVYSKSSRSSFMRRSVSKVPFPLSKNILER